jgi:hypothetical protein
MSSKIDFSMQFSENQAGRVFDIEADSRNREPIADITYKFLPVSHGENKWLSLCELKSEASLNDSSTVNWYLNCSTLFNLIDRDQLEVAFLVRARESDSLHTDLLLRVIDGDMCKLTFDGEIPGGHWLRQRHQRPHHSHHHGSDMFQFKFDEVYRHASLGIEMKNAFDYEKLVAS